MPQYFKLFSEVELIYAHAYVHAHTHTRAHASARTGCIILSQYDQILIKSQKVPHTFIPDLYLFFLEFPLVKLREIYVRRSSFVFISPTPNLRKVYVSLYYLYRSCQVLMMESKNALACTNFLKNYYSKNSKRLWYVFLQIKGRLVTIPVRE